MLTPRRRFLIGAGALMASGLPLTACKPGPDNAALPPATQTLISLVDTIIPQDQFEGALQLGLDKRLLEQAAAQANYRQLLDRLVKSISGLSLRRTRSEFHQLEIDQREALLNGLLGEANNALARRDLKQLRNTLLSWYYQSPAGAASVGYLLPARYPAYPAQPES